MDDQVPEPEKTKRSGILQEMERKMSRAFRESFIGKEVTVLLEERIEKDGVFYMVGHTPEYVKAAVLSDAAPNTLVTGAGIGLLEEDLLLLEEFHDR